MSKTTIKYYNNGYTQAINEFEEEMIDLFFNQESIGYEDIKEIADKLRSGIEEVN